VKLCVCARSTVAVAGEIEFVAEQVTVTLALADFAPSATLTAETCTVDGVGGVDGAVYCALLFPLEVIVPKIGLPPATPFTLQITPVDGLPLPVTVAMNAWAEFVATVADVGEMLTAISSFSVTTDDAVAWGSALLEAVTVTFARAGRTLGAVYKPVAEIVPTIALPPATPPAAHVTFVFAVPVTVA
jgi:hypothetical protein